MRDELSVMPGVVVLEPLVGIVEPRRPLNKASDELPHCGRLFDPHFERSCLPRSWRCGLKPCFHGAQIKHGHLRWPWLMLWTKEPRSLRLFAAAVEQRGEA